MTEQYPPMWEVECLTCNTKFYTCYPAVECGCSDSNLQFADMDYHSVEKCEVCDDLSHECAHEECQSCSYEHCECICHRRDFA